MQIEHIAGVGLPSGGPLQQQTQRPVGHGVLGEIIIDDQNVPALPHEVLAQCRSGIGGNVLQGRRRAGGRVHHDGIIHSALVLQILYQLGDGAGFLPDGNIDAHHALPLLVQNGVQSDGGLAGLPVADDQLPLSPSDGEHGIDGEQARLHRSVYRLAVNDAGGRGLNGQIAL